MKIESTNKDHKLKLFWKFKIYITLIHALHMSVCVREKEKGRERERESIYLFNDLQELLYGNLPKKASDLLLFAKCLKETGDLLKHLQRSIQPQKIKYSTTYKKQTDFTFLNSNAVASTHS